MTTQVRHVTDAEIVPKGFDPYDETVFILAELWPALNSDSTSTPQPLPPVRRGVFLLPNILTTGCLACGFFAIVSAIHGDFARAGQAIFAAMVFDGLDGRVARWTRTESVFGKEFDSLADMVSFGVAPALVLTVAHDPLCDEGVAYAHRLDQAGVRVAALHYNDQMHGLLSQGRLIPMANTVAHQVFSLVGHALHQTLKIHSQETT